MKKIKYQSVLGIIILLFVSIFFLSKGSLFGLISLLLTLVFSGYTFFSSFSLYFPYFYSWIILVNILGFDDKSIILYTLSPPFWILNRLEKAMTSFALESYTKYNFPNNKMIMVYLTTIVFGFIIGLAIDLINRKVKKLFMRTNNSNKLL